MSSISPSPTDSFDLHNGRSYPPISASLTIPETGALHSRPTTSLLEDLPLPGGRSNPAKRPEFSATVATRPPLTETSPVVIACCQCRSRKIRCDSGRPSCRNCARRGSGDECRYDSAPKRRGPDKKPGTRQRSCKKRPADEDSKPPPPLKRKRTSAGSTGHVSPCDSTHPTLELSATSCRRSSSSVSPIQQLSPLSNLPQPGQGPASRSDLHIVTDSRVLMQHRSMQNLPSPHHPFDANQHHYQAFSTQPTKLQLQLPLSIPKQRYFSPLDIHSSPSIQRDLHHHHISPLSSAPVEMVHALWWQKFLTISPLQEIADNVKFLFHDADSSSWLSFLNIDKFMDVLKNPQERYMIEPAFILATLALTTLMRSSELGYGTEGRERALQLRREAQERLDFASASGSEDVRLAEASLIITLFEMSVHPEHHPDRLANALKYMDDLIRRLGLSTMDSRHGDLDVSCFPPNDVPSVYVADIEISSQCLCSLPDGTRPSTAVSVSNSLPWDPNWTHEETMDEEKRRVVWCALGLVASYTARCTVFGNELPTFFLTEPSNYGILFPGEVSERDRYLASPYGPPRHKETVWAIYCRSMLLWCHCNRVDLAENYNDDEKAEFAQKAWSETQSLHDSIATHTCNIDTELIYLAREYIFNARSAITRVLRSLHGLDLHSQRPGKLRRSVFNRKHAEEWLYYQDQVSKTVYHSAKNMRAIQTDHHLIQRPYQVTWYTNQLALCLLLWGDDKTLTNALELGKSMMVVVDLMNVLWPCPAHQKECSEIKQALTDACQAVGIKPPVPVHLALPPSLTPPLPV